MGKAIAGIKNGVVVEKLNAGDVDQVVLLQDSSQANLYDAYDGKSFTANPDAAAMAAVKKKKMDILNQLQKADEATITAVDAVINPKP